MMKSLTPWLTLLILSAPSRAASPDYETQIRPILKERCYACHGALKQEGDLRLDTVESMKMGGYTGPAVEAGDAEHSLLFEKITESELKHRMPPEGPPLSNEEIEKIRGWIADGAVAPEDDKPEPDPRDHWAFRSPKRSNLPTIQNSLATGNPIDAFIAARLETNELQPNPPAKKEIWLRRVYIDLTGLPPTRGELHEFMSNSAPDAYERVVDRLLSSPRYGERWGRHWMDVWRYSDWYGRRSVPDVMNSYPMIWRWRDWIIRSLNEDKGYDRMVTEMLAADEINPLDQDNVVATGFVVRNWYKWNYNSWMQDMVEHTGKAFLGLTMNCCHCHDHKYDPISHEDYFRFRAFFEPLELRHDEVPGEPDPGPFKKYVYAESYGPIKSGLVRIFDEKLTAQTRMYAKGEPRKIMEGTLPVQPGVPRFLHRDELAIEAVELPLKAHYPGLSASRRQQEENTRRKAITESRTNVMNMLRGTAAAHEALAALQSQITDGRPIPPRLGDKILDARWNLEKADWGLRYHQSRLHAAETELQSFHARLNADLCRFEGSPGDAEELSKVASKKERESELCKAEADLLGMKWQGAVAAINLKQSNDKKVRKQAKAAAKVAAQQIPTLKKNAGSARKEYEKEGKEYTTLTPVYPDRSTGRRTALAKWITDKNNPLTARVAVNHIWARHFGRPLVETTFDFGRNGKRPSHPQLLDWLARELMDNQWSMKHLHRMMVLSNTYRMASTGRRPTDPDNKLYWKFNTYRMEAEAVRDSILHVSGQLDPTLGGHEIPHDKGQTSPRRSIYFAHHGEEKMQFLDLFDAANPCDCYQRTTSVMPQQALALSNSRLIRNNGRHLAGKLTEEANGDETEFIRSAFEQILSRPPTEEEAALSEQFLAQQAQLFAKAETENPEATLIKDIVAPSVEPAARARQNLVIALLNHNDFVVVR